MCHVTCFNLGYKGRTCSNFLALLTSSLLTVHCASLPTSVMPYLPQTAQGTHPDTGNPYLITSYTYTTQTVDECQKWEAAKAMSNMSGKDGPPATFTPSRNSKFIHERMMTTGQPPEGMRQRLDPQHGSLTTIGTAQLSSAQLSMIDFHKNPTWM